MQYAGESHVSWLWGEYAINNIYEYILIATEWFATY